MKASTRRLGIALAGAGALCLAWFAPSPEAEEIAAPRPSARSHSSEPSRIAQLPERSSLGEQQGDLFGARVARPVVKEAAAPAPAAPQAPANPYKVAGTVVQDGAKRVFLTKGDRIYEARQGDALDDAYKIESIGADHVVLVYLPLEKREQLPIPMTLGADVPAALATSSKDAKVASSSTSPTPEGAKPVELRWEGPEKVRAGSSFTLALRASSAQSLRASPMQLTFEPALLQAVDVRAGKFFGQGSFSYRVNPEGSIFVGASGAGSAPGAEAELLVVVFKPLKGGATAEVKLSSVALQGAAGRTLAHNQISAFRTTIQ